MLVRQDGDSHWRHDQSRHRLGAELSISSLAVRRQANIPAIGGYLLFDAEDLDAAIEPASRIPAASMGGAIEVRPVEER